MKQLRFVTDEMEVTATETEVVTDMETVTEATVEDGTVTGTEGALTDAGHQVSMSTLRSLFVFYVVYLLRGYKKLASTSYKIHDPDSCSLNFYRSAKRKAKTSTFQTFRECGS